MVYWPSSASSERAASPAPARTSATPRACSSASALCGVTSAPMICPPSNATSMRTRSALARGNHLRENTVDGIRMDECDLEPEQALARRLVDESGAGVGELGQGRAKVADFVGDVV